ncbi:copper resistance protein CopC [Erythrobacter donghaensis]|uniref:copper resistance protein CopC n=1 Tax=Erythrobacter donghaensis TaxID=267135 RepID=UPI000A3B8589|nr:copper resistance protein CopC [Erythrobacter donghaensis]
MRIPALLAALALTALSPSGLAAHVALTASTPTAGSAAKAPKVVTLTFSQAVDPSTAAASIVMTAMPGMSNHGEMAIRNFTPSWSADKRTLTLTLKKPLPAGTYEVRWQAAAGDGHAMTGTLHFTVG